MQFAYHPSKPTQLFLVLLSNILFIFIYVEEVNKPLVTQYCQLLTIPCLLHVVLNAELQKHQPVIAL